MASLKNKFLAVGIGVSLTGSIFGNSYTALAMKKNDGSDNEDESLKVEVGKLCKETHDLDNEITALRNEVDYYLHQPGVNSEGVIDQSKLNTYGNNVRKIKEEELKPLSSDNLEATADALNNLANSLNGWANCLNDIANALHYQIYPKSDDVKNKPENENEVLDEVLQEENILLDNGVDSSTQNQTTNVNKAGNIGGSSKDINVKEIPFVDRAKNVNNINEKINILSETSGEEQKEQSGSVLSYYWLKAVLLVSGTSVVAYVVISYINSKKNSPKLEIVSTSTHTISTTGDSTNGAGQLVPSVVGQHPLLFASGTAMTIAGTSVPFIAPHLKPAASAVENSTAEGEPADSELQKTNENASTKVDGIYYGKEVAADVQQENEDKVEDNLQEINAEDNI